MDLNATTRSHRHFHSTTTFRKVNHKVHKSKALALRCGILIHETKFQSLQRAPHKAMKAQKLLARGKAQNMRHFLMSKRDIWSICGRRNALSRNLGIYFHWLTFVVTQIISMSQVRTLLRKQKNSWLQNFKFFCKHQNKFFGVVRTSPYSHGPLYNVAWYKHLFWFKVQFLSIGVWHLQTTDQPRPQDLLAFQYGGDRREDPGTQRTKTIGDWCIP